MAKKRYGIGMKKIKPKTWYLVPNTWYQVLSTKYQVIK